MSRLRGLVEILILWRQPHEDMATKPPDQMLRLQYLSCCTVGISPAATYIFNIRLLYTGTFCKTNVLLMKQTVQMADHLGYINMA